MPVVATNDVDVHWTLPGDARFAHSGRVICSPDNRLLSERTGHSLMSPRASALATAEVRLTALSLRDASTRWNFTVRSEIFRITEISHEVLPPATQRRTSRSRAVNTSRFSRRGFASDRMRLWA